MWSALCWWTKIGPKLLLGNLGVFLRHTWLCQDEHLSVSYIGRKVLWLPMVIYRKLTKVLTSSWLYLLKYRMFLNILRNTKVLSRTFQKLRCFFRNLNCGLCRTMLGNFSFQSCFVIIIVSVDVFDNIFGFTISKELFKACCRFGSRQGGL